MVNSGEAISKIFEIDKSKSSFKPLEYLVRETVQNSIDASRLGEDVSIQFKFQKLSVASCKNYLKILEIEDVSDLHLEQFRNFEIRDVNTKGLVGPKSLAEYNKRKEIDNSFVSLVCSLGHRDENSNSSGGSYGHGKTVLFQFGVGMVVFYSKIKMDDSYEERLSIISLGLNKKLLKYRFSIHDKLGLKGTPIAYWGDIAEYEDQSYHQALTNKKEIYEVLSCLGVKPFGERETGTSISIPWFTQPGDSILTSYNNDSNEFEEDLCKSIVKFYSRRICNSKIDHYSNGDRVTKFSFMVNDIFLSNSEQFYNKISVGSEMARVIILLHSLMADRNEQFDSILEQLASLGWEFKIKDIGPSDNELNVNIGSLGWVSKKGVSSTEKNEYIKFLNPNSDSSTDNVFISYSRNVGMDVSYHTLTDADEDKFVIGTFYLNDNAKPLIKGKAIKLGEYFRSIETNKHDTWKTSRDKKIHNAVFKSISSLVQTPVNDQVVSVNKGFSLGRDIALKLFPKGFGKIGVASKPSSRATTTKIPKVRLSTAKKDWFKVSFKKSHRFNHEYTVKTSYQKRFTIKVDIVVKGVGLDEEQWDKNFSKGSFPFYDIQWELNGATEIGNEVTYRQRGMPEDSMEINFKFKTRDELLTPDLSVSIKDI